MSVDDRHHEGCRQRNCSKRASIKHECPPGQFDFLRMPTHDPNGTKSYHVVTLYARIGDCALQVKARSWIGWPPAGAYRAVTLSSAGLVPAINAFMVVGMHVPARCLA